MHSQRDVLRHLGDVRRARRAELVEMFGMNAVLNAERQPDVVQEGRGGELWLVLDRDPNRGYSDDVDLFGGLR